MPNNITCVHGICVRVLGTGFLCGGRRLYKAKYGWHRGRVPPWCVQRRRDVLRLDKSKAQELLSRLLPALSGAACLL
ncbi:hypothetical protein CBOM_07802 [Ceraceosorus bombacis]|uniref:Uncharacterized protein n=1 Tax=Ceraceosorus bombacis TaxID=401625 RepID=A0A0P1BNA6_9BASI|nr:hypothetical protein CBOM_07802 [Ceraceosorus bombacis]